LTNHKFGLVIFFLSYVLISEFYGRADSDYNRPFCAIDMPAKRKQPPKAAKATSAKAAKAAKAKKAKANKSNSEDSDEEEVKHDDELEGNDARTASVLAYAAHT
jgi:hypothetical protein